MHDQLQGILNKCVKKGRNPFGKYTKIRVRIACRQDIIDIIMIESEIKVGYTYSYHDLFSKDSGLMEFVKRKECKDELIYNSWLSIKDPSLDSGWSVKGLDYHYMIMGSMTAGEKVKYFIDNVIV